MNLGIQNQGPTTFYFHFPNPVTSRFDNCVQSSGVQKTKFWREDLQQDLASLDNQPASPEHTCTSLFQV